MTDEFGNDERNIRLVAIAAHARGDFEAQRIALDRLALMERARLEGANNMPTAREVAEDGGPVMSCPVDHRACLAELCEPEFGWPCMKVRSELERRGYLAQRRLT